MFVYDIGNRRFLDPRPWTKEDDIDALLVDHPNLLAAALEQNADAGDAAGDVVVPLAANGIGGQLQGIDLIALHRRPGATNEDASGSGTRLVLIENKRGGNPELSSRKALGQLLEYAARVDRMSTEEFVDEISRRVQGKEWLARYPQHHDRRTEFIDEARRAFEQRRLLLMWCADEFPRAFVDTLRWLGSKLHGLPLEALDATHVGTDRPLVAATALASLMTARDAHELSSTRALDQELAGVASLLLGKPETWFAELKRIHEGTVAVRAKPSADTAEETVKTRNPSLKSVEDFLELADASLPPSTMQCVEAVVQKIEALKSTSATLATQGLSGGWSLYRTVGGSNRGILRVTAEGEVRFVFLYLQYAQRQDLADRYREQVSDLATVSHGNSSRGVFVNPSNVDSALAVIEQCVTWLDDALSKPVAS